MAGAIWHTSWYPPVERYRDPNWHCRIKTVYEGGMRALVRERRKQENPQGQVASRPQAVGDGGE